MNLLPHTLRIIQIADDLRTSGVSPDTVRQWIDKAIKELMGDSSEKPQEDPSANSPDNPDGVAKALATPDDTVKALESDSPPDVQVPIKQIVEPAGNGTKSSVETPSTDVTGKTAERQEGQKTREADKILDKIEDTRGITVDGNPYYSTEEVMEDMGVPRAFITSGSQRGVSKVALKEIRSKLLMRYVMRASTKKSGDVNHFGGPALDIIRDVVTLWLDRNRNKMTKVQTPQAIPAEFIPPGYQIAQGDNSEGLDEIFENGHTS